MGLRRYGPLVWRVAAVTGVLMVELLIRASLIDDSPGAVDYFPLPQSLYRFVFAWVGVLAILMAARGSPSAASVAARLAGRLPAWPWLVTHAVLAVPFILPRLLSPLFSDASVVAEQIVQHLLLATALLSLLLAVMPASMWRVLLEGSGRAALVALLVATATILAIQPAGDLWQGVAALTFRVVRVMIGPFYPDLQLVPETLSIFTNRIEIHIDRTCSGLEGIAMMLVVCSGWLWYLRREFRFPRALLLLPAAVLLMFLLNALRLALLTALAAQGHVAIATAGFHSQAGWIFFIGASFLVALASHKIGWLRLRTGVTASAEQSGSQVDGNADATAAYLLPLVAILATGMLTRALSAGFDPLQWLRVPVALALLLLYRSTYAQLDWRFSWRGIAAGVVVFGAWLLAAHWLSAPTRMPEALAQLPPLQRVWWIATRALIAVVIVPVAEELAFRGYLMRRLRGADFTTVRFQDVAPPALLLSSLLFGLSHGSYWLPGIFAGVLFGIVAMRTGRIGEAIAAHATANALLTIMVLGFDQWQHW